MRTRCVDSLKTLLAPFLPFTSQVVHELLGHEGYLAGPLEYRDETEEDDTPYSVLTGDYSSWHGTWAPTQLPPGQTLQQPRPLFTKLDPERVVAEELERMQRIAAA